MSSENQSAPRQGGGLKALKEQSDAGQCETPNRPYLKAIDEKNKTVYFIRPDCKLWSCKSCAQRRRRLWVYIANYGGDVLLQQHLPLSFVTLTSHEDVTTVLGGVAVWRDAWKKLSARWRRKAPGAQYFYIAEHKNMLRFHVHMVTSADIQTRWYKDNARECGLGYEADARPIVKATACGAYMGKYLGKALMVVGWPKYWRRVNTSRAWPKPQDTQTPYEWETLGSNPSKVIFLMEIDREQGWIIEHSLKELDWRQ